MYLNLSWTGMKSTLFEPNKSGSLLIANMKPVYIPECFGAETPPSL